MDFNKDIPSLELSDSEAFEVIRKRAVAEIMELQEKGIAADYLVECAVGRALGAMGVFCTRREAARHAD